MKSDIDDMVAEMPEPLETNYDLWHNDDDEIYIDFGDLCSPVLCYRDPKTGKIDDDHVMEIPQYVKNPWYRQPVGRRPY
jgi:hypothetical protein